MNAFLAEVEKRAFNMARISVRDTEDALDIVQDAMLILVRKYAHKPSGEWRPLFFRILQNRIHDHHRRQTLSRRLFGWLAFGGLPGAAEDGAEDPMSQVPDLSTPDPALLANQAGALRAVESAVAELPSRQQQAFLLRTLEGFSVADTAIAMGCSEGSVKTHYSRAVHTLRAQLQDYET